MTPFLTSFRELFTACFGKELSWPFAEWLYGESSPYRPVSATFLDDSGTMKGHSALLPVPFALDGGKVKAGLTISSMVHPDTAGGFPRLLTQVHEMARGRYDFLYGFPNPKSEPFFRLMFRWTDLGGIQHWQKRPVKRNGPRLETVHSAIGLPEDLSDLTTRFSERFRLTARRSPEYLVWRYFTSPRDYTMLLLREEEILKGYVVISLYRDGPTIIGDIVDLVYDEGSALPLLTAAENEFWEMGADLLDIWEHHPSLCTVLEDAGFSPGERTTHFVAHIPEENAVFSNILKDRASWYTCKGDSDVY